MNRATHLLLLSLVSMLPCGCNLFPLAGPSGPPSPPGLNLVENKLNVSVVAPAGLAMPTQVRTSLGAVGVTGGAAPATPIFNHGPQFAIATDAAGNAQLMGFVGTGAAEINTRTTAEVMLFFSLNAPLLSGAAQEQLLAELKKSPAVQALADAIGSALAADGLALANKDPSIQTALHTARGQLLNLATKSKSPLSASRVLIDPSDTQSGLTVTQLGLTSINVRNDFRRRAYYYVEAVSYVPQGGGDPVPSHLAVSEGKISPTAGATSIFGAISDIVSGNQAYTGVDSGAIDVPVVPNSAESTTYKVTVVGIGARAGDENSLTDAQTSQKRFLILESFVVDFFIPAFVDLLIPIKQDQIDRFFNLAHANDLVAGLISAVGNAAPQALDAALSGDVAGALTGLWSNLLADGSARVLVLEALFQLLDRAGMIGPGDSSVLSQFTNFAEAAIGPLDAVDSILIGFDSLVQVKQIASSNRAQTFKIVSDRSKVKLTPLQADIGKLQSQVFTATIPDATGTDATLVYHWNCTGLHGGMSDGQHSGTDFDSTTNFVNFVGSTAGNDTVTVEAFEVQGQNRVSLGKATANVKVRDLVPSIAPDRISLNKNESQTFTASVDGSLASGGTLTYIWFSSNKYGQLTRPVPHVETTTNTSEYAAAGTPPGEDTVAVEVFSTKDGVKTSLGIARAQVKIEERKTIIMGSFNVEAEYTTAVYTVGTPGYTWVTAYAKVPKVEGATSYSARIYNFYDGAYWGHGTTFSDYTVRHAEDRGSEYWIGLAGGHQRDEHVAASVAGAAARFVGIIVEVTVTY